ncbi:ThiF family adenylyltransferase [Microbacterium sediminis]|uniref:Uncharacterized protein n=1 Tax=Microbacterium sediminis TaxID=904291 RepID=A0A1B9NF80_9MICO|nr:ThiF family adenylyltransferase [Microbacterium sediminis]OCG75204.1 hypothetical protein A7J15_02000 [Microbacterium sediminis]QBR74223.1 hypothetical protein E3O41_07245 [Microbacterium sediminis]
MPFPPLVEPVAALSDAERARTARHRALGGFGELAQRRLAGAHVALVGAGGLGSPAILALAAAGVGRLTVIDDDAVELSNLQRQVLHRVADVGTPKALSAARAAAELSPQTRVDAVRERLHAGNARELLAGADLVLDGSDTFDTRVAVAAACEDLGAPLVWGVVQEFHAQVTVFWSRPPAGASPVRLGDLYPSGSAGEVPTCAEVGVLGALCLQVGALMAQQAIALITGVGEPLLGRLVLLDGLRMTQREVPLRASAADRGAGTEHPAVAGPPPAAGEEPRAIRPGDLRAALATADAPLLVDVRGADERATDPAPAPSLHVPLDALLADPGAVATAAAGRDIVTLCRSGVRSRTAALALRAAGAPAATLAGGIDAWRSERAAEVPA